MGYPASRLNFFKGQLLRSSDLIDQETFHADQAILHDRTMHGWGIVEGLLVIPKMGDPLVTVTSGAALDAQGRSIYLPDWTVLSTSDLEGQRFHLVISFNELPSDPGDARITQAPTLEFVSGVSATDLVLATVYLDPLNSVAIVDYIMRRCVGVRLQGAGGAGFALRAVSEGAVETKLFMEYFTPANVVTALPITIDATGKVGIAWGSPTAALHVNGQIKITGGGPGAGKVLTSDATGLASWQPLPAPLVSGPATSNPTAAATFANATGKVLASTGVTISAADKLAAVGLRITAAAGSGKVLVASDAQGNGGWQTAASQSIASGPATSTVNGVSAFADATGKALKSTTVTIDAANKLAAPSGAQVIGTFTLQDTNQGTGKLLVSDVSGNASWQTTASQSLVSGPASSADTQVPTFAGTSGKALQSSGVTVDAAAKITMASAQITGGSPAASKILVASDGAGNMSWQSTASQSIASGPASSTVNGVTTFLDATGKLLRSTGVTIDAANKLTTGSALVSGTFTLQDTTQGTGKLLVSDASGNASWQTTASQSIAGGPAASTINGVTTFLDATGKLLRSTGVTIDAASKLMTGSAQITPGPFTIQDSTQGAGKLLVSDVSGNASWQSSASQSLVASPGGSNNTALVSFNGATGKLIQNTGVTIDAANKLTTAGLQIDGGQISLGTGASNLVVTSGTSVAPRSYAVPDVGATGALVVLEPQGNIQVLRPEDDAVADGVKAGGVFIRPSNKTAGNGDGGDLLLQSGTSAGGNRGMTKLTSSNPVAVTQTSASGPIVELLGVVGAAPAGCNVTTFKVGAPVQGFFKVFINGAVFYLQNYGAPTS